jgi:uncharacterized membrane protein YciS (DUF1049 family)
MKINRRFGVNIASIFRLEDLLATCFHAGFLLGIFLLKMEAICSSETSIDVQRTTRRYIPEDGTLHK